MVSEAACGGRNDESLCCGKSGKHKTRMARHRPADSLVFLETFMATCEFRPARRKRKHALESAVRILLPNGRPRQGLRQPPREDTPEAGTLTNETPLLAHRPVGFHGCSISPASI